MASLVPLDNKISTESPWRKKKDESSFDGSNHCQQPDSLIGCESHAREETIKSSADVDESSDGAINTVDQLSDGLSTSLQILEEEETPLLLCDMGYGLPREERPRKERLNAIAKQLVTFLSWQVSVNSDPKSIVKVVACPDPDALLSRLLELWPEESLPDHVSISEHPLKYAPRALDPHGPPPRVTIVGLLIDRRVQPNRSRQRAEKMDISLARWPALVGWDPKEPFNVDCVLEGMQQWHWNYAKGTGGFLEAAQLALDGHQDRHPQRVQHIPMPNY